MVETCMRNGRKVYLHPIIEWSDEEVWQYIRERQLPYCKLYDEGHKRIGCIGCPMGSNRERDFARWPKFEAMYRRAIARMNERNAADRAAGTYNPPDSVKAFGTVEKVWAWWMSKADQDKEPTGSLFE
jgi:phosphoadenosine phosphosulfate reductase